MTAKEQMFPILGDTIIKALPWGMVAPHEVQAQRNHSQSIPRLASRGGLGIDEVWYVLNEKPYDFHARINKENVRILLMRMVKEYYAALLPQAEGGEG